MYTANWCPAEGEFSSFSWERKVDIRIDRRFQDSTERFRRQGASTGRRSSWFFVLHDCHIAQVAVKLLGIEAESHITLEVPIALANKAQLPHSVSQIDATVLRCTPERHYFLLGLQLDR